MERKVLAVVVISIGKAGIIAELPNGRAGIIPRAEMNQAGMTDEEASRCTSVDAVMTGKQMKGKAVLRPARRWGGEQTNQKPAKKQFQLVIPEGFSAPLTKEHIRIADRNTDHGESWRSSIRRGSASWSIAAEFIGALMDVTELSWENCVDMLFAESKRLARMPDDMLCIQGMLRLAGFDGRAFHPCPLTVEDLIRRMNKECHAGEIALVWSEFFSFVSAVVPGKNGYEHRDREGKSLPVSFPCVGQVWIRRANAAERRTAFHKSAVLRRQAEDSRYADYCSRSVPRLRYYQPNPQHKRVGDCGVRAVSAAFSVPWEAAFDRVSAAARMVTPTFNKRDVCEKYLVSEGYVKQEAPRIGDREMTAREFCEFLERRHPKGVRVLALLGDSHVAAVLPDNDASYRVWDNWDSTECPVKGYYVSGAAEDRQEPGYAA